MNWTGVGNSKLYSWYSIKNHIFLAILEPILSLVGCLDMFDPWVDFWDLLHESMAAFAWKVWSEARHPIVSLGLVRARRAV